MRRSNKPKNLVIPTPERKRGAEESQFPLTTNKILSFNF